MTDLDIIRRRIEEVTADNAALRAKIKDNDLELSELETADRVFSRLIVAKGKPKTQDQPTGHTRVDSAVRSGDEDDKKPSNKPEGLPSMPELILMALKSEKRPMEPKEITDVIRRNWWPDVDGQKIGSIVWRLNNRNDIEKVEGTSTYRLPQKNEPPDDVLGGNASGGSLFDPDPEAQGPKARPGGGP